MTPSTSRSGIGLLFIAGAIGLHFLSFVFQYTGYLLPNPVPAEQESFYYTLHTLWLPLLALLFVGASAAVLIVGFWIVWRDRAHVDPSQRAFLGLAGLGFAASVGAALIRTSLGLDRKSTRLNSSHITTSYAVFCLKTKNTRNALMLHLLSRAARPSCPPRRTRAPRA